MKRTAVARRTILATSILALTATAALAQTWDAGGDGLNWNDALNWNPNALPVSGAPNLTLNFTSGVALPMVQNLAAALSVQKLNFGGVGPFTISGNPIIMDNLGAIPSIESFGAGPVATFLVPVTFNATTSVRALAVNFAGGLTVLPGAALSGFNAPVIGGTILNNGIISGGGTISANISGTGSLNFSGALSGTNSYSGGSNTLGGVTGTTNSIQGNWSGTLIFNQAFAGTMAGKISGAGSVQLSGVGKVTLSGVNTYSGQTNLNSGTFLGLGNDAALGTSTIQPLGTVVLPKMSAEGGSRTIANVLDTDGTGIGVEITGANNLTFSNAAPRVLRGSGGSCTLRHTSTATTILNGTFSGDLVSLIDVQSGTLVLGAPVNGGFRTDGAISIATGATLRLLSNNPVRLGVTNLTGGTLAAANGVAVPTGLALTGSGAIAGRVAAEAGSLIEATGALTLGDAAHLAGYFSNGELRVKAHTVTLADKNQATLGSITELGAGGSPGTLVAANGVFVDFSRGLTGYGTVDSVNALAKATIINGSAEGASGAQPLDFTGYVKGLGTFSDVTFSGTFSPGLSPAIVPVENAGLGGAGLLLMEIGGLTPGAEFDQLDIAGVFHLDGTLDVDLLNGFAPSLGDSFLLFDGATSGAFDAISLPALGSGLAWETSALYSGGTLAVVPEPSAALLLLGALTDRLARRARR